MSGIQPALFRAIAPDVQGVVLGRLAVCACCGVAFRRRPGRPRAREACPRCCQNLVAPLRLRALVAVAFGSLHAVRRRGVKAWFLAWRGGDHAGMVRWRAEAARSLARLVLKESSLPRGDATRAMEAAEQQLARLEARRGGQREGGV